MPDIFDIDASSGVLSRRLANNELLTTTFEELSGGRLNLSGGHIIDTFTGEDLAELDFTRQSRVQQMGDGRLLLQQEVFDQDLNTFHKRGGADAIGFNYQIEIPTGEIISGDIPLAFTSEIGAKLIVRHFELAEPYFEAFYPHYSPITGEVINLPPDARLATADEVKMRAIQGFLLDKERDTLERLAAQAITDETGKVLEHVYDVALFLARSVVNEVTAMHVREL